jgi:hypothetical protein
MPYINNTKHTPDKSLYYKSDSDGHVTNKPYSPELAIRYIDKKAEFEGNQIRTLGAIKSIISSDNVDRFKDKTTASDLWDAIKATYGETSLETIARYFNKIIDVNYNSFKNADEYTSHIQSSALYLKDLGHALPEPFIAILLFKGLSSSFDSFSSRKYEEIANELKFNKTDKRAEGALLINIPKLIADIISEESRFSTNEDFVANKAFKNINKPICKNCKKEGHIIDKCWILHPELKKSKSFSILVDISHDYHMTYSLNTFYTDRWVQHSCLLLLLLRRKCWIKNVILEKTEVSFTMENVLYLY